MPSKQLVYLGWLCCLLLPASALAITKQEAEEKLQTMEQDIAFSKEQFYDIETELSHLMKISGYMDMEYHVSREKGSYPQFRLHHFSLFFNKNITEKWRFFSEIEYQDGPRYVSCNSPDQNQNCDDQVTVRDTSGRNQSFATMKEADGGIFAEAFNVTYQLRPELDLRFGREFTPAGLWNVDHYPPYLATQQAPQHIRNIFPRTNDGISAFGVQRFTNTFLSYNVYLGNGEYNSGAGDGNASKSLGARLSITLPAFTQTEAGLSLYHDTWNNGSTKDATGVHLRMKANDFTIQSEVAHASIEQVSSNTVESLGYYLQAVYDWRAFSFGYRYDVFDDNTANGVKSPTYGAINSLIFNYHSAKNVVFKLEYHMESYEDSQVDNYNHAIASVAVHLGE